jgi:hypothetical protein
MAVGSGNVEIRLANKDGVEEERQLKPSIYAMRRISQRHGGLRQAIDKIEKLDFDTITDVLEAGLGLPTTVKARDELSEAIFRTGITSDTGRLAELCVSYIIGLMRGGKPMPANGSDVSEEADEANPPMRPASP